MRKLDALSLIVLLKLGAYGCEDDKVKECYDVYENTCISEFEIRGMGHNVPFFTSITLGEEVIQIKCVCNSPSNFGTACDRRLAERCNTLSNAAATPATPPSAPTAPVID